VYVCCHFYGEWPEIYQHCIQPVFYGMEQHSAGTVTYGTYGSFSYAILPVSISPTMTDRLLICNNMLDIVIGAVRFYFYTVRGGELFEVLFAFNRFLTPGRVMAFDIRILASMVHVD
jgi:hypothetical protein